MTMSNIGGDLTLPDIKAYYKAMIIKIVWYWYKDKHKPMEQN